MRRSTWRIKSLALCFASAAVLTYVSLLVPGHVNAVCGNLGEPSYCSVLAYGFPLPFLADSQGISPVGSVARDPLSIAIGMDDLLWPQLGLAFLFWMLAVALGASGWRRWMQRKKSDNNIDTSGRL